MRYYTMLFVDPAGRAAAHNGSEEDFRKQIEVYAGCCETLGKSLAFHDPQCVFSVITNDAGLLRSLGFPFAVEEIRFSMDVPRDIRFFSAHHKFEVFRWLGETASEYSILLDSDVACVNPMPQSLAFCARENIPTYYDITAGIFPVYGASRVIADKSAISGRDSDGMWAGGEFIGGDRAFFRDLSTGISALTKRYFELYPSLHHQGDEMLTSIALEQMMASGRRISEVGRFEVIGRYWSVPTAHVQNGFDAFRGLFLLHLPADKAFLAAEPPIETMIDSYVRYMAAKNRPAGLPVWRRIIRKIKHILRKLEAPSE